MNYLWGIYIVLFLLLCVGIQFAKSKTYFSTYLSLDTMKALQGFLAICIIIHHLSQKISNFGQIKTILWPFVDTGAAFVGLFLFSSGYGLYLNTKNKENYLSGFFKKRLPSLLLPFYFITIFYFIVFIIDGKTYSFPEGLLTILGIRLVISDMWFVIALSLFYILFFFTFRFIKKDWIRFSCIGLGILTYITIGVFLGHGDGSNWVQGEWWYNSSYLFMFGMLWAKFEKRIIHFFQKTYVLALPFFIALFIALQNVLLWSLSNISYYAEYGPGNGILNKYICCFIQTMSITAFVTLLLLINMKIKFSNNVLIYLGSITLEIYLVQRLFIMKFEFLQTNYFLYFLAVCCGSVILASGFHYLTKLIKRAPFFKKKARP